MNFQTKTTTIPIKFPFHAMKKIKASHLCEENGEKCISEKIQCFYVETVEKQ